MVLTLGLVAVVLGLVLTVADAGTVFVARRELAAACDGAATAAAQAADEPAVYAGAGGPRLPLDLAAARVRVARYVQQVAAVGSFTVTGVDAAGTTVTLSCARRVAVPFAGWLHLAPRRIALTARAASPYR
jgi:hypothetical protein